jgi:hypothetical protein
MHTPYRLIAVVVTALLLAVVATAAASSNAPGNGNGGNSGHASGDSGASGQGNGGNSNGGNGNSGNGNSGNGNGNSGNSHSGSGDGSGDSGSGGSGSSGDSGTSGSSGTSDGSGQSGSDNTATTNTDDAATDDAAEALGVNVDPVLPSAEPVLAETVSVSASTGKVLVRLPGSDNVTALPSGGAIPSGSVVDARRGVATLVTALPDGTTQVATLWGSPVKVVQRASGMTDLFLRGRASGCPVVRSARVAATKKTHSRMVWVKDHHGRFRSHGKNSVATVRGTVWMTKETCAGTLTRVAQGLVAVKNVHTGRTTLVRAGHSYLARFAR